ncbi:glycosyltransferase family 25 protein [Rhodohalobacter sp. 8-1]|uniref:glycosyltransferase family 25 protein n=1 Tax=Rhodohalobacter sp. 8-1 TaxID=3131972 RepID=UPI0030ECF404
MSQNKREKIFSHLNEFFDKIYVITLKRSKARHASIKHSLKGLDYEIYWAVDGMKLDRKQLEKEGVYSSEGARRAKAEMKAQPGEMTMGAIGCALSHIGILEETLEQNYQNVLILEDDISVNEESADTLVNALEELPPDWELFYLGYLFNNNSMSFSSYLRQYLAYPILKLTGIERYDPHVFRCKFPRDYSDHLDRSGFHYGCHAYGVTPEGARKLIESQKPLVREIDILYGLMCQYEEVKAFNVKERVFHQNREDFPSTIDGT